MLKIRLLPKAKSCGSHCCLSKTDGNSSPPNNKHLLENLITGKHFLHNWIYYLSELLAFSKTVFIAFESNKRQRDGVVCIIVTPHLTNLSRNISGTKRSLLLANTRAAPLAKAKNNSTTNGSNDGGEPNRILSLCCILRSLLWNFKYYLIFCAFTKIQYLRQQMLGSIHSYGTCIIFGTPVEPDVDML